MIRAEYHEIDGAVGFAEVAGDGPPVLCLHTAGQTGAQWREVLHALPAHGYRVIAPDLPGHGRSESPLGGPVRDLRRHGRWLAVLLHRLGAQHPFVVGCSIGGKLALELALDPGVAPRGVVAMAADAHNRRLSVRGLERSLEDAASPSRSDRTYLGTLACVGRAVGPERAARIAAMHRREDPVVSAADLIAWTSHDLRDRLGAIACPVRLVAGEDDFWIDLADTRWAAGRIPGAAYEELAGVGHYPMEEIEGFPELLATWLRALGPTEEETGDG
ncbi:alpha/beta hydrolase [Baekduia soli]|uniref:Alpha/beta hydrolase n=1 Tax=Baekduia soli TaxID=496014 RepID=A0A5B8U270_9ACTN|nr:alpha/beta fold hydrolase [Baekduia soli]QEC47048.1 alpha/beta hydrolase [Baekduia soli]